MRFVRQLLLPLLGLLLAASAAAQRVDFLDGELNARPLCQLSRAALIEELGIPSRVAQEDDDGPLHLTYAHLGLDFEFRDADTLDRATVTAVEQGEMLPYAGHFLGPIASDTTRAPVLRLLRGAGGELSDVEGDRVGATLDGIALEVSFWEDYITGVELRCLSDR